MKTVYLSVVALVVSCFCCAQDAGIPVTVRGRVLKQNPVGTYPAAHVSVTLTPIGREAVTGDDGIFYLYKIPPGNYVLEIRSGSTSMTYRIGVTPGRTDAMSAYYDIPEIVLTTSPPG
jgi:hypothetical protein